MTPVMRATPAAAAAQPQTLRWDGWRCHLLLLAVCVMLLLDTFLNHVYHDEEALLQGQDWREMSRDAVTLAREFGGPLSPTPCPPPPILGVGAALACLVRWLPVPARPH